MSTSIPVRIRNGASSSLSALDQVELLAQALAVQALGHGEPRRVVGDREVLVAEGRGGAGHRLDPGAAVGPVGVAVESPLRAARSAAPRRGR